MDKPKILIADDDQRLSLAISERLKANGYEVLIANDAYFALANVHRQHPDVLILDIHMPAGDGFSVQERMNSMPDIENVPVIYITGDTSDEACEHARAIGACAVIYKPIKADQLLQAVERALRPKAA